MIAPLHARGIGPKAHVQVGAASAAVSTTAFTAWVHVHSEFPTHMHACSAVCLGCMDRGVSHSLAAWALSQVHAVHDAHGWSTARWAQHMGHVTWRTSAEHAAAAAALRSRTGVHKQQQQYKCISGGQAGAQQQWQRARRVRACRNSGKTPAKCRRAATEAACWRSKHAVAVPTAPAC